MTVQLDLCGTWSETPKKGFLTTRLILIVKYLKIQTHNHFAENTLKLHVSSTMIEVMPPNDADDTANSENPDQTTLIEAV